MDVSVGMVEPRLVALIHTEAAMADVPATIGQGFAEIMEALSDADQEPSGPPMVSYDGPMIPDQPMSLSPGIPVSTDFTTESAVTVEEVPGGRVLIGLHQGSYAELGSAHRVLMDETVRLGLAIAGAPREVYLNDPTVVAEADLLTRIEYPVAPATD